MVGEAKIKIIQNGRFRGHLSIDSGGPKYFRGGVNFSFVKERNIKLIVQTNKRLTEELCLDLNL